MLKRILKGQRGFTLVELVVVTAIMGVLASTATPLLVNFLGGAKEEAYNADLGVIQTAVDAWQTDPANIRFLGKNQYPLLGRGETDRQNHFVWGKTAGTDVDGVGPFDYPDNGNAFDPLNKREGQHQHKGRNDPAHKDDPAWNPLGGIQGADLTKSKLTNCPGSPAPTECPAWTDDGDGVREIQSGSADKWTTVKVTRDGVVYFTDARYYFVDLKALVDAGFLREIPKSSSADNSSTGTGSYTYYVDDKGRVQTLLFSFPRIGAFAEGVYP